MMLNMKYQNMWESSGLLKNIELGVRNMKLILLLFLSSCGQYYSEGRIPYSERKGCLFHNYQELPHCNYNFLPVDKGVKRERGVVIQGYNNQYRGKL